MFKFINIKIFSITIHSLIIFLLSLLILGCSKKEEEEKEIIRPVIAFQIPSAGALTKRNFPGRARATQEIDLAFRVAGPLIEFPVDIGDEVKKGQVVARIDPRDFEVAVQSAQGRLDNAKASSVRAESEYRRELSILKQEPGATSQTAVDRKREARDSARANINSFRAELDAAQDQLSYTVLTAPFEGTVVNTYVENFENVQAKQPILRIVDVSYIEMIVNIPENLISFARYVKDATVVFDPFPDVEIPAVIKEIGKEASRTTRTFPVTLIMKQPESIRILPGMAGKARGTPPKNISPLTHGTIIPVSAVFTDEASGETFVWIIDETSSTVSMRKVETGTLADTGILVLSGLEENEWIASAGVHYLFEGQKVRIQQSRVQ